LKYNTKDRLEKKILRGRLMKLMNHSIVREKVNNETEDPEENNEAIRPKKRDGNFRIDTFPDLISRDHMITAKNLDSYVTPHELIYKNFTQEEIDVFRSDPNYFFKNQSMKLFKKLDILKTKTLIEKFNDEEERETLSKVSFKNIKHNSNGNVNKDSISLPKIVFMRSKHRDDRLRMSLKRPTFIDVSLRKDEPAQDQLITEQKKPSIRFKDDIESKLKKFEERKKVFNENNTRSIIIKNNKTLQNIENNRRVSCDTSIEEKKIKNIKRQIRDSYHDRSSTVKGKLVDIIS